MGALGGILRATGGSGVSVVNKTKNPALQTQIDSLLSDFGRVKSSGEGALGDYISKYLAGSNDNSKWGGQEISNINNFFNGDVAQKLAQLRSNRAAAVGGAADLAANQAIRNVNLSRLGTEGGPSSYDSRLLISALAPIRVQQQLDNANQERSDYDYVTKGQLSMAGQRENIANQMSGYGLVPEQLRRQMYSQNLGYLGGLGQLDQMNKFYGLKQDSNMGADIADSIDQGVLNAGALYGSMGGGMARGGMVRGPGTPTSDSIPIHVSQGEFVMPASSMRIPGVMPLMQYIRHLGLRAEANHHYRYGGMVHDGYAMGGSVGAPMGTGYNYWNDVSTAPYNPAGWQTAFNNPGFSGSPGAGWGTPGGAGGMDMGPKQSGGGGGGLAGSAQALQARVDRDLSPGQFIPSNYGVPAMVTSSFDFGGGAVIPEKSLFWNAN